MKTLIVPDIHESIAGLAIVTTMLDKADRVVFLGDWFDTFAKLKQPIAMADFIMDHKDDPKYTWLMGNHDAHYFYRHPMLRCSGYNIHAQDYLDTLYPHLRDNFKIFTDVDGWLVSHAGFTPATYEKFANAEAEQQALTDISHGISHDMFAAGRARGGHAEVGGPTWLDWTKEFQDVPNVKQIVGHSAGLRPRESKGGSWCIDCNLTCVGWVEDGEFRYENL